MKKWANEFKYPIVPPGKPDRQEQYRIIDDVIFDGICNNVTLTMLALSNKQYGAVQWLVEVMDFKGHEQIFEQQEEFEYLDYSFARFYLQRIWDVPYQDTDVTCVTLALANKQHHVVEWLIEEKKVAIDEDFGYEDARHRIGETYFDED